MGRFLIISNSSELVRVVPERIVCVYSDANYCMLVQADGETRMLSLQLGELEQKMSDQLGRDGNIFVRVGRSLIINTMYVYYIDVARQKLILSDQSRINHQVTASREALKHLKEWIESSER